MNNLVEQQYEMKQRGLRETRLGRPLKIIQEAGIQYVVCKYCKHKKPIGDFANNARLDKAACLSCLEYKKVVKAAWRHGISVGQYNAILKDQNDRCACCGDIFTETPHLDHDHITGWIRGILCRACNHGLGEFEDNPQRLINAIKYLERKDCIIQVKSMLWKETPLI